MAKQMSENSRKVLDFLKEAGVGVKFTSKQIKEALGIEKIQSVSGSIVSFCKKGFVEKSVETVADAEGKEKEVKFYSLTDTGMNFNPDAVTED